MRIPMNARPVSSLYIAALLCLVLLTSKGFIRMFWTSTAPITWYRNRSITTPLLLVVSPRGPPTRVSEVRGNTLCSVSWKVKAMTIESVFLHPTQLNGQRVSPELEKSLKSHNFSPRYAVGEDSLRPFEMTPLAPMTRIRSQGVEVTVSQFISSESTTVWRSSESRTARLHLVNKLLCRHLRHEHWAINLNLGSFGCDGHLALEHDWHIHDPDDVWECPHLKGPLNIDICGNRCS